MESREAVTEALNEGKKLTSNVTGQVKPGLTAMDVLRAALPAGTLSGAPKIRAMQLIDELDRIVNELEMAVVKLGPARTDKE